MQIEKTQHIRLRITPEMFKKLTEWRRKQTPIPSLSDVVRGFIEAGLAQDKKPRAA